MFSFRKTILILSLAAASCSEAPLIQPSGAKGLNNPISMALIPGTNYAVVASANISLTETSGSLMPLDLVGHALIPDGQIAVPSFSGFMAVDTARSRIYLPDRGDDALLVFQYALGGTTPVTLSAVAVPTPADRTTNGIVTDDNPVDVAFVPGATAADDFLFVTNELSGSITMASAETLIPLDLNPDDSILNGLILISAANFQQIGSKPGKGANRIVADGQLLYVTSTTANAIYVIDTKDRGIEAMIDLSTLTMLGGTRDMVIAGGLAFIVHRSLNSVIVLDVSGVRDDGIDYEVLSPVLVDLIPTGKDPQGIAISPDGKTLYVTNQGDNTLSEIDVVTRTIQQIIPLPGNMPGELIVDAPRNTLYILNFLSNDITYLDIGTGVMGEIR